MNIKTREIIGVTLAAGSGICLGKCISTILVHCTKGSTKHPLSDVALYSLGSIGAIIILMPTVKRVSDKIADWVFEEEIIEQKFKKMNNSNCKTDSKKTES